MLPGKLVPNLPNLSELSINFSHQGQVFIFHSSLFFVKNEDLTLLFLPKIQPNDTSLQNEGSLLGS